MIIKSMFGFGEEPKSDKYLAEQRLAYGYMIFSFALIIITGVIHRFGIMRRTKPSLNRYAKPHLNRYIHTSFSISLYLLIIIHSAHGFNLI